MESPIQMHPSKEKSSPYTFSYHDSISTYGKWMTTKGFALTKLEEWSSHKSSTGKRAKMENRAREEFPLFLALEGVIR